MDSFGRLPDDVLKYICYLQSKIYQPVFDFDEQNHALTLTIDGVVIEFHIDVDDFNNYLQDHDTSYIRRSITKFIDQCDNYTTLEVKDYDGHVDRWYINDDLYSYQLELYSHSDSESFERFTFIRVYRENIIIRDRERYYYVKLPISTLHSLLLALQKYLDWLDNKITDKAFHDDY